MCIDPGPKSPYPKNPKITTVNYNIFVGEVPASFLPSKSKVNMLNIGGFCCGGS